MKPILLILLLATNVGAFAQEKAKEKQPNMEIEINSYKISPAENIIYKQIATSGTDYTPDGERIDWDGYEYVPDERINFKTTSLIFMGGIVAFKEYFPIQSAELSSLKVIYHGFGFGNGYTYTVVLSTQENMIYVLRSHWVAFKIEISGYTHLRQLLFTNNEGKLFFLPYFSQKLMEVDIPLDKNTIQYVGDNYLCDKNGLYFYDEYGKKFLHLETASDKNTHPVLFDRHLVYGDAAYPYVSTRDPKKYRLDAGSLRVVSAFYKQCIFDENKYIEFDGFGKNLKEPTARFLRPQGEEPTGLLYQWEYFDTVVIGGNLEGNTLYYSSNGHYAGSGRYYDLIRMPQGFLGITGSSEEIEAVIFENIMIYNHHIKEYEPIEIDKFRRITQSFYLYKNILYFADSHPVETPLNLEKLRQIRLHEAASEFYTDGIYLSGNNLDIQRLGTSIPAQYGYAELPFRDVDWETLHIVNEKMMIDKNNLYQMKHSTMQIIPLKDLGIPVSVIETIN